jgi:hypothetical protein|tara:strand:+ start:363 stop:656 length:294 start_codon:yes stop_codon:yes gene_type:complete
MNKDDQTKLNQEITQANKAKLLFENPIFKNSFDQLRKLYQDSLFNTGVNENETREKLWLAYNIVNKVEQHFIEIIETGKLANKQLESFRDVIKDKKF